MTGPVAAGIAVVPEASPYTSITTRTDHVKAQGQAGDLKQAEARQRRRIEFVAGPGGINLALPDRRSSRVGFVS